MTSNPNAAAAYYQALEDDIRARDIRVRIHLCDLVIRQAQEQRDRLRKQISYPRVLVTLHYKTYRTHTTSDLSEGQTLEQAYHLLWHLTYDNGTGSPLGIEVGGCMVTWEQLVTEFGEYDPW